jgi:hypothetical protein
MTHMIDTENKLKNMHSKINETVWLFELIDDFIPNKINGEVVPFKLRKCAEEKDCPDILGPSRKRRIKPQRRLFSLCSTSPNASCKK